MPAALERARAASGATDRPSIYGAIAAGDEPVPARRLRKSTLLAISRAIEDETLARAAGPVVIGAFQSVRNFEAVEHRYERLARAADACVVFADFDARPRARPATRPRSRSRPRTRSATSGRSSSTRPATPRACWRGRRRSPSATTTCPTATAASRRCGRWTRGSSAGPRSSARRWPPARGAELGARLEEVLRDRPLAFEAPAPGLTSLTNRIVGYLD